MKRNSVGGVRKFKSRASRLGGFRLELLESRLLKSTITVTSLADNTTTDGQVTLREAIQASITHASVDGSTAGTGNDTIVFASNLSGTISLTTIGDTSYGPSALAITDTLTINGANGGTGITIAGGTTTRLFIVPTGGSLTLNDITLSGGTAAGFAGGSGEMGGGGSAGLGGAIYNQGTLTLTGDTLANNQAIGGAGGSGNQSSGLLAGGGGAGLDGVGGAATTQTGGNGGGPNGGAGGNSTSPDGVAGGVRGGGGGSVYNGTAHTGGAGGFGGGGGGSYSPTAGGAGGFGGGAGGGAGGIATSEFAGGDGGNNFSGGGGGGGLGGAIFNDAGSLTITNSTFNSNGASGGAAGAGSTGQTAGQGLGGAIFNRNGSVALLDDTLSGNIAGSGGQQLYSLGDGAAATVTINDSILGQSSTAYTDFVGNTINSGTQTATGTDNIIRTSSGFTGNGTITSDPELNALASNGGYTQTMSLQTGSPAILAATNGASTDQRGYGRGTTSDIGAYETAPSVVELTSSNANGSYTTGGVLSIDLQFSVAVNVDATGGTPTLTLNSGGTATYTVGSTDNANPLDAASTSALALNGGTIRNTNGTDALLTLPTGNDIGSLASDAGFVVDTTAPTSVINTPADGSTFGPTTWSGYITGTASDGSGSGVANVTLSILGPNGLYWNGTAFAAASEDFLTAVSTTSWAYHIAGSNLGAGNYTVHEEPTDNVGIVGIEQVANFTINTAGPAIAITPGTLINGAIAFGVTYTDTLFSASTLSAGNVTVDATGTAAAGNVTVTGAGTAYTVTLSGITGSGTIGISLAAGTATNTLGNHAAAATSTTVNLDPNAPYITGLYHDVLGRSASAGEISGWLQLLNNGTSRTTVAQDFYDSDEEEVHAINIVYQDLLGRDADSTGLAYYLPQVDAGLNPSQLEIDVASSDEFAALHPSVDSYVTALYGAGLGRAPVSSELTLWENATTAGVTRAQIANTVFTSPEYTTATITGLYTSLFHRAPDSTGIASWTQYVAANAIDPNALITQFTESNEYYNLTQTLY
jgi:hypothetical protein